MTLTAAQAAALRELGEVWPAKRVVIIGATALGFYYDMSWRKTADVDLAVAVELDEFPGGLTRRPGWEQDAKLEPKFRGPGGVQLDIIPAGPEILQTGSITWSRGHVMNMTGMDLALGHAEAHPVGEDEVWVAPPAVIALLKMTAYLDRPGERLRDLDDLAHLLDIYVNDDSPRRWSEASEVVEFELAPGYLLGLDMGHLADGARRAVIDAFLDVVGDSDSVEHAQMERRGPNRWSSQDEPLAKRLAAFRDGLAR